MLECEAATHGISGNFNANPDASSSAPFPQELHQWSSSKSQSIHPQWRKVKGKRSRSEMPVWTVSQKISHGGDSSKNQGGDQQRLQIFDLHFDIPYTSHACLLEDKVQDRGTRKSPRSHCCKTNEFFNSLQSCTEIHSYASSIEDSDAKAVVEK